MFCEIKWLTDWMNEWTLYKCQKWKQACTKSSHFHRKTSHSSFLPREVCSSSPDPIPIMEETPHPPHPSTVAFTWTHLTLSIILFASLTTAVNFVLENSPKSNFYCRAVFWTFLLPDFSSDVDALHVIDWGPSETRTIGVKHGLCRLIPISDRDPDENICG